MKKTKEHSEGYGTIIRAIRQIGFGVVAGGCICAVLLLLFAFLFLKMKQVPVVALSPISIGISALGAFIAGLVAGKLSHQRGLLYGSIAGLVLFLLFLISNLSSGTPLSWVAFARMGVMVLAGAIGGLLAVNKKRKRK